RWLSPEMRASRRWPPTEERLLTDAELLRAACEPTAEAWKTLYARYLPLAWRYAYTQANDVHLAEDAVSETMLAFLKNMHQIDINPIEGGAAHIAGWLRSVVRNKVADHHRQSFRIKDRLEKIGRVQAYACETSAPEVALEAAETRTQVLGI